MHAYGILRTYVRSTVQSARLCWCAYRVPCGSLCVWFLSIAVGVSAYISHFPARPLTLTPLCYSDRNPQWSDLSAPRGRERSLPSALCLQMRHRSTARSGTAFKWVKWRCLCWFCRLEELILLSGLTAHTFTTQNPPAGLFVHNGHSLCASAFAQLEWKNAFSGH